MIGFLICFFIIIVTIYIIYLRIKAKVKKITKDYFGTDNLKEAISISEIEASHTPKSLFGMENIYTPQLQKDFPDLNISEIKAMTEDTIIKALNAIESKDLNKIKNTSNKVNTWIRSKIKDIKENEFIHYDSIKVHKTILNNYSKTDDIVTIIMQSAVEYKYKENNELYKKYQKRYTVEFIHIMDINKIDSNSKVFSINCPNCGASLKNSKDKYCKYCESEIVDIVDRVWIINNIKED